MILLMVAVAADIVAKEVDNKMVALGAGMTVLQQQTNDIQKDMEEQEEINKRRTSVITHGLKEPTAADSDCRKRKDEKCASELLHQIHCNDASFNACIRLGKLQQGPDIKPRPIKLVLSYEAHKDKLLSNAKNLRGNSNGYD